MSEAVVVTSNSFPHPDTLPLITDVQYYDPYSSAAANRKFKGILKPGIYAGFTPSAGDGLNLLISSGDDGGTASFDIDSKYQITVRQQIDINVSMTAGKAFIVVLEATYALGTKTYQVNANSSIQAAQIKLLETTDTLASNQLELCTVTVPSGTTQLTDDMIDFSGRVIQSIGVEYSNDLDSDEEGKAATPKALKAAIEKLTALVTLKMSISENGADIEDVDTFLKNLGLIDSSGYCGRLINIRTIKTSGTYTPTAGTKVCYAELQAGGGGGGSAGTCASGQSAGGGGGAAGAYALIKFAPATMPVVIGSGSNGAPANASGASTSDAGNTSIAGVTVYGGGGGWGGPPRASFPQGNNSSGRPGAASNTGTATIVKEISGQPGQGGIAYGATNSYGGGGGNSALGTGAGGGITTTGNGVGASGAGYGSGGSGSAVASGASSVAGGNGAPGVVIIWEYA